MSTPENPWKDALDKALDKGTERVPQDSGFGRTLKQAGWGGLIMAVLIGNVPVTALVAAAVKGRAQLDSSAIETYFTVFVLVTPWVVVAAGLTYLAVAENKPQMSGAMWCFLFAGAVFVAGAVSVSLGGVVPATVVTGPQGGSPGDAFAYGGASLGAYIDLYGPWPPLAGAVEGGLFGYWISELNKA